MRKTILITGSTDGIGLETAKLLISLGHQVLLHGRNPSRRDRIHSALSTLPGRDDGEGEVQRPSPGLVFHFPHCVAIVNTA